LHVPTIQTRSRNFTRQLTA